MKLEKYYEKAHSGEYVDNKEILEYIKSFKNVVLWGGSYLGQAVGKYLINNHVVITNYWDIRFKELKEIHGIRVVQPFSTGEKTDTLILFCIANNVIRGGLLNNLRNHGYSNVIRGDYFYMGALCPFDKSTGIESQQCQGSMCCRSIFCERLSNIVKSRSQVQNPLHMFSVTLIVNQKCSLGCKFCTSYMNEYPLNERINMPTKRILDDIDKFFAAMDSLGTVTVMGGEPFMHSDLDKIMERLLEKSNFGIVSIATSGTYPINPEILPILRDKRVNISFSNYTETIKPKQKELFYKNIELVKQSGVSYTVGVVMGEWSVPSTLYDLGDSEKVMSEKKRRCIQPPRCMQIKNGKLHPCDFGNAIHCLGINQDELDYVNIAESNLKEDLNNQIRNFIEQPYYKVCGYCRGMQGLTAKAAEQGYMDFKQHL